MLHGVRLRFPTAKNTDRGSGENETEYVTKERDRGKVEKRERSKWRLRNNVAKDIITGFARPKLAREPFT